MSSSTSLLVCVPALLLAAAGAQAAPPAAAPEKPRAGVPVPACPGDYADDVAALNPAARKFEQTPGAAFSYCARTEATYECIKYGTDGALVRHRFKVAAHGTAFAYKAAKGETLLVTNHHVAEYPAVSSARHRVEDVPNGCKRVTETLKLVDDEKDAYDKDDILLHRVVTDPQLDVAIVRARQELRVMPWKIGRAGALRERNAVVVPGFPLGAFQATAVGKVISLYDRDDDKDWDHDDFVVDALLSGGNSGSPVLAISCRTGEYELVGVYHAAYSQSPALNVVVGVEQFRDMMTSLKRRARPPFAAPVELNATTRKHLVAALQPEIDLFFGFGKLPTSVRVRPDASLVFVIYGRDFPATSTPVAVLQDLPGTARDSFGERGHAWVGGPGGLRLLDHAKTDFEGAALYGRVLDAVRRGSVLAADLQRLRADAGDSKDSARALSRVQRKRERMQEAQQDLATTFMDAIERLLTRAPDKPTRLKEIYDMPSARPGEPKKPAPAAPGAAPPR